MYCNNMTNIVIIGICVSYLHVWSSVGEKHSNTHNTQDFNPVLHQNGVCPEMTDVSLAMQIDSSIT